MKDPKRFVYETRPLALAHNVVVGKRCRFTVLTPNLIRLEYSPTGQFEDRASQSVFFRDFPQVDFTLQRHNGTLTIETEQLFLTCREDAPFAEDTLSIRLKVEPASTWHYGEEFEDLGGTVKTLDDVNGAITLERGVCSRGGFSVLDDSGTMLLNENGWVEVRRPDTVDCYFFGYGYRYLDAVKDFSRLTGVPPMLPAYALGNWWSRYHKYTQEEYCRLIDRFKQEEVPFSVSVIDMDWHLVDIPEHLQEKDAPQNGFFNLSNGWTGYTWNKELFPDHRAFLQYLKQNHLHTSLNLHPHAGVRRHEEMYAQMAQSCGIDPQSGAPVRLDILSPEFMERYFDILHHPYEEDGVDFWWMDWQQGNSYWWIHEPNQDGKLQDEREVLDPLWMLNHLHIADIQRSGKRPMFFSRYAGPGSQRYPVGFSGDTYVTWASLDFQPYFTATASNIGYGWWSHDIGGHMGGYRDDELAVRWLQFGVFSPINRLHSSNTDFIRKEPWCFEEKTERIMKDWLRLRHRLFPYLYTMTYRNHTDLEPLIRPMYYAYPKNNAAYEVKNQYLFGTELMVAPITRPNNSITQKGSTTVWLPKGDWFDLFSGLHYTSKQGRTLSVHRAIGEYPVFAKAGAIVPLQQQYLLQPGGDLEVLIFPGADNCFTLYEDAGDGSAFAAGEFAQTEMTLQWGSSPVFTVKPVCGAVSQLTEKRKYRFVLRGFAQQVRVNAWMNDKSCEVETTYDETTRSLAVTLSAAPTDEIRLLLSGENLITDNGDLSCRCSELLQKMQLDADTKVQVMKVVDSTRLTAKEKLRKLNFKIVKSEQHQAVMDALLEQLDLTE